MQEMEDLIRKLAEGLSMPSPRTQRAARSDLEYCESPQELLGKVPANKSLILTDASTAIAAFDKLAMLLFRSKL